MAKLYRMKKSLLTLTIGGFGIGMTEFVMMGILPDIAKSLQITIPEAGHLVSAYALGVVVGAPLLIGMTVSKPPKKILIALMCMFTVFNAISAFATSYPLLMVARFFSGLPHGAFFGVGSVVAGRLAEKGREARAVSIMFAGLTVANLLGVPLGTYIGHNLNYQYTFMIIAAVGVIATLGIKFWMPALPVTNTKGFAGELKFFGKIEAWMIVLITAIGTGGLFAWYSYIAPLLTEVSGFGANSITYILIIAGFGMFVGNIIGGRLADKYSPLHSSAAMLLAMAVSLMSIHFVAESKVLILISTFITGALAFALAAPIQMLMIKTANGSEMLAASVAQASFNIGNALGAFLGGLPIAAGLGYTSPEWVGAGLAFVGFLIALALAFYLNKQHSIGKDLAIT